MASSAICGPTFTFREAFRERDLVLLCRNLTLAFSTSPPGRAVSEVDSSAQLIFYPLNQASAYGPHLGIVCIRKDISSYARKLMWLRQQHKKRNASALAS